MSRTTILFSLVIIASCLTQLSLQAALQPQCVKEFKEIFPTATEVQQLQTLSTKEMIGLVSKKNASELTIRKMEHGFLHRTIGFPASIKSLFDLSETPKELIVVDSKNTIHLVNYYYGVLWSSFNHPTAKDIISVSEILLEGSEKSKTVLVGYTYDNDNKFGLDVVDMENLVILNSVKNVTGFKSLKGLKKSVETQAVRVTNTSVDIINYMNGEVKKTIHNSSIDEIVEIIDDNNSSQIIFFNDNTIKAVNCSDFSQERVINVGEKITHLNRYWNITNWVLATTENNKLIIVDWNNKKVKRDYNLGELKMTKLRSVYAGEVDSGMFVVPVSDDLIRLDLACFEENLEAEYDDFGVNLAIGVGLGLPLLSFLIVFAFIAYNRRLDAKENYIDANEMNTDTKV